MTHKDKVADGSERERIHELMREVVSKSSKRDDPCVYRGEPACYSVVSSGLYRKCLPHSAHEAFDIARVELETVERARQYTTLAAADDILTEIQHLGGATNLIDFTDDYLVAFFFASDGCEGEDGRVVLHWPESDTMVRPKHTMNRIVSQKSVFVRPPRGFIVPDAREETVIVPGRRKGSILEYLERFHGISKSTVYNDIHGFIRHQDPKRSRNVRAFREVVTRLSTRPVPDWQGYLEAGAINIRLACMRHAYHQRGMAFRDGKKSQVWVTQEDQTNPGPTTTVRLELAGDEVVQLYTWAIEKKELDGQRAELYCRRAEAHLFQGSADLALRDFDAALKWDANMPEAYHGRGCAYKQKGAADRAMADWEMAMSLSRQPVAALIDRGNTLRDRGALDEAMKDFDAAVSSLRLVGQLSLIGVGDALFHRAVARCLQQDWVAAKADFEEARNDRVLVAASFHGVCAGVQRFEAEHRLGMPSTIGTMLYVASSE